MDKIVLRLFLLIVLISPLAGCKWSSQHYRKGPVVVLNFDDGYDSVYTNAFPIMRNYGISGTIFVNSGLVGTTGRCTWEQLDSLQIAGWEIGSHTYTHINLTMVSIPFAEDNIRRDYEELTLRGFHPVTFALPFGWSPGYMYPVISRYFTNIRTGVDLAMRNPIDRHNLGYYTYDKAPNSQNLADHVAYCSLRGDDLINVTFHRIVPDQPHTLDCTVTEFARFMRFLHEQGYTVMTTRDALDYLEGR